MDELTRLMARIARLERQSAQALTPQLPSSSMPGAVVQTEWQPTGDVDEDGDPIYTEVPKAIVGALSDGTHGVQVLDGPTPSAPSEPTVVAGPGFISVEWDGLFEDGLEAPLDFSHVAVHVAAQALVDDGDVVMPSPETLRSTIHDTAGAASVIGDLEEGTYYVSLVTVTTAGVWSEPAPYTTGGPDVYTAVDVPALEARIDAAAAEAEAAQQSATAAQDAATSIIASGSNLVRNGNGLAKNTLNWGAGWNIDLADVPPGAGASFTPKTTAQQALTFTDVMPLEAGRTYNVSAQVRQRDPAVTTSRFYLGLAPVDVDGLPVSPSNVFYIAGTMTTLAEDLKPGDTTIKLSSAANWYGSSGKPAGASNTHLRGLVAWNYVSPSGRSYGLEYSRNVYLSLWSDGAVDLASNTVTLSTPWPSSRGTIPAGTQVSNSTAGGTYVYMPGGAAIAAPAAWTTFSAQLKLSPSTVREVAGTRGWTWGDYSSAIAGWRFIVLANYTAPGTLGVANVSVSDTMAAQDLAIAAQNAAQAADQKAILAQASADGKSTNYYSTLEPDPLLGGESDTWWQYDAAGVIVGVWERDASAWVARAIGNEVIDAVNAGKITTGTLGVGVSINVGDPNAAHLTIDASGPGITVYRPDGDGGLEASTVLGGEVDQFAINKDGVALAGISPDGGISGQSLTIASDQVTIDGELLKEKLWEYAWGYRGGFTAPADSIAAFPASEIGRNLMNVKWRMIPGRRYEIRFRMDVVTNNMMDAGRLFLGFHYGVDKNPDATDPRIEDTFVYYPKGMSLALVRPVYGSFLVPYNAEVEQTGAVVVNMRNPWWNNAAYNTWSAYLLQGSRFSVYDVGPYRPQDTTDSGVMYTAGGGGETPAKQTYVKTYACTWGKTWTGANPHAAAGQEAWHGNSGWQYRGQLGYQQWSSDVSGATISKVEVYLYCRYTYYASGADIGIGVHSNASAPSGYTGASGTTTVHFAKPEGKWVTLPSAWYPNFANGTWKGISINPNGVYTPATYAKICGTYEGPGHVASQVRITYTK